MVKKKSTRDWGRFSPFSIIITIFAGLFSIVSVVAAFIFGKTRFSKRKKEMSEAEALVASRSLLVKLGDISVQLKDFQGWLKDKDQQATDIKELQHRYAGLKNLYSEWTSHRKMEEILATVTYDPKIGMTVSNGLYELRSLNITLETILRDDLLESDEGARQLETVHQHLSQAIELFDRLAVVE